VLWGASQPDDFILPLSQQDSVEVRGFAYTGGGRRIIIVELSLDDGKVSDTPVGP
jgi:hypothetical protein